MKCYYCGTENPDASKFCRSCGANIAQQNVVNPAVAEETPKQDKKKFTISRKHIMLLGATIVAVGLIGGAIGFISSLMNDFPYVRYEDHITCAYNPESEKTEILFNAIPLQAQISGCASIVSMNEQGNIAALLTTDNTLYAVIETECFKIADDINYATLSADGSKIAYYDTDEVLYTIELQNKKIAKIAEGAFDEEIITFSPNGEILLYGQEGNCGYIYKDGISKQLDEKFMVFASDDGEVIIGIDEDSDSSDEHLIAYNFKRDETIKIAKNTTDNILVSSNRREMLIGIDSKYYISINGGERIKVGNYSYLAPLLPRYTPYMGYCLSSAETFVGTMLVYCEDSTYSIGYIDESFEMQKVIKDVGAANNIYMTDDNSAIYYIRSGNLYVAYLETNYESEKIASDVVSYKISQDGKEVYYVDSDETLFGLKNGEEKEIAEDVHANSLDITLDDTVFFLSDYSDGCGTLYRCSDGKNKVRIADDISTVIVYPKFVAYYTEMNTNDQYVMDIYVSTNDKDFEKIADEVTVVY